MVFLSFALLAEIIGTLVGFGSSTILLPIAVVFFDFQTALVLVAIFHIFGNLWRVGYFRHGLDRTLFITFGGASVVFALLGALLVTQVSQAIFKAGLGLFLLIYAMTALGGWHAQVKPTRPAALFGGSLTGFITGLIGTGGALRGVFLTAFHLPKERYIATMAALALATDLIRLPVYVQGGFLTSTNAWYILPLLVISWVGVVIGRKLVTHIPEKPFRTIVLAALGFLGLALIADFLTTI